MVPKYHVEEMNGDAVTATHIVNASTPLKAAREATERDVTLRTNEPIWIRVTDEKRGHIFAYSFSPMTKLSDLGPPIRGIRHDGAPAHEEDNFYACEICGQKVDMRDLRQVAYHQRPDHEALILDE